MTDTKPTPLPDNNRSQPPTGLNCYTLTEMATLFNSSFSKGYSNSERQAAIRALLRHGVHTDGVHHHARTVGGLHPSFVHFNPSQPVEEHELTKMVLAEASLKDVFDAVSRSELILAWAHCYKTDNYARSS
jgi:hypothetical protein